MSVEQIYEGAYLLHGEVGGRPLHLPLLVEGGEALLMDTGCAHHVDGLILPALRELGIPLAAVKMILSTHPDFDHVGGNHGMKALAPLATLACGSKDRSQVESPSVLYDTRYDAYRSQGIFYPDEARAYIMGCLGEAQAVDDTFAGGESFVLGAGRELQICSLPGHSWGHLAVLDVRHKALFAADAIHGAVYLGVDGKPSFCPTYLYPSVYVDTADRIEAMELELYSGCHWPVMRGAEIAAFCAESREYVRRAERLILAALAEPRTLRELCMELGPQLGDWPAEVHADLCYSFQGHLDELMAAGRVVRADGMTYGLKSNVGMAG